MSQLLNQLNPPQKQAVEHVEGPLLVLAGAGSGKTRVIVHRMAHLIDQGLAKPWQLLAVTFTNKAATQMRERIAELIPGVAINESWVGTFHGLCHRILRQHIEALDGGWNKDFLIYDAADQKALVKRILRDCGYAEKHHPPRTILSGISRGKTRGLTPSMYSERMSGMNHEVIAEVYGKYQKALRTANALDFDDLMMITLEILDTCDDIRESYQERFKHVLVDEYQDTNPPQYRLIRHLSEKADSLCVVGDEDQSIYRWRGAEVENILRFEKDFSGASVIKLEQNYRSTKPILDAANAVVANNTQRLGKNLWTDTDQGDQVEVREAWSGRQEVDFILGMVEREQDQYSLKDQAILYRTNFQSRGFEESLLNRGVAYQILGGLTFYERREVKDLLAYLRLLTNPNDDVSFLRVVNVPTRGIGKTTLSMVEEEALSRGQSMMETARAMVNEDLLSARAKKAMDGFLSIMFRLQVLAGQLEPADLLEEILSSVDYLTYLASSDELEAEVRLENVRELVTALGQFSQFEGGTLGDFLARHALESDLDSYEETENKLTLMTVHAAKGLEFDCVYLVGLEEDLFPHSRTIGHEEDIEEERRLMYVGMTRARKKLTLSYAIRRSLFGQEQSRTPSRFLAELPAAIAVGQRPLESEDMFREDPPTPAPPSQPQGPEKGPGPSGPASNLYKQVAQFLDRQGRPDAAQQIRGQYGGTGAPNGTKAAPGKTKGNDFPQKKKTAPSAPRPNQGLRPGSRIRHAKYGFGTILSREGTGDNIKYTIRFQTGARKKMVAKYAKLQPA